MSDSINNKSLVSISLILLGIILLLKYFNLVSTNYREIYGYVFSIFGIISVYTLSGSGNKGGLFAAGVLFILGISFIVLENYEILSPLKLFLPTILFSAGTGFALLFIDNFRERVFFVISFIMFVSGVFSVIYFDVLATIQTANRIAIVIFYYWPVVFVLIGFSIILNRNRV
jgi:hypothetical protein